MNESVKVFARRTVGDPGCVRDYVYIDDAAGANIAAMEGRVPDRILNIGTGRETTTQQLAEHLRKSIGSTSEIIPADIRPGDVERSLLDADRLVELLGPTVSIEKGLAETAEWFRKRKAAAGH